MKIIRYNRVFGMIVPLLLAGCAIMAAKSADTDAMKGRDVDEVIAELKGKGLTCGQKYSRKVVNSKEFAGTVGCGTTEKALICPKSYGIGISFDLVTNRVNSATKYDPVTTCF